MTGPEEERLLDLIYSAAVAPSLWPDVLSRVTAVIGGAEANGSLSRMDIETGVGVATVPTGSDHSAVQRYFDYYFRINPIQIVSDPTSYAANWQPCIKLDEDVVPRDVLERSEYYNDFLTKTSSHWGMIIRLGLNGLDIAAINVTRGPRRGRFEQFEIAKAARLQPHLIRAFRLSEEFESVRGRNASAISGLAELASAMIVLDRLGRVLYANPLGDTMLTEGSALTTVDGQLTPVNRSIGQAFAAIVARAGNRDWDRRGAGSICLPSSNGGSPLIVTTSPLGVEQASAFSPLPAILVSISDPSAKTAREKVLQRQFGLSAAEGRLAVSLLDGLSLREASIAFGVRVTTVRTQLASLFAKTDTHRQTDLVRLLMQAEGAGQGRR